MFTDVLSVLKEDRTTLKGLVERVQTTRDFRKKQQWTNDLYLSRNEHMHLIETSVLPLLKAATGPSLPDSFFAHHEHIRDLLSDLMAHRVEMAGLNKALTRLCPVLILQSERERLFLLPAIDRALEARDVAEQDHEYHDDLARNMRKNAAGMPWTHTFTNTM